MRYTPVALPPQEPSTVWLCADCGAMVHDTAVHDRAVHSAPAAQVAPVEYASPTLPAREYLP